MVAGIPGLPTEVECLVFPAPHSVPPQKVGTATLDASGRVKICRGQRCLGNPDARRPLRLGKSVAIGPFRCTSLRSGVRCVVTKTGRGFVFTARGVKRL